MSREESAYTAGADPDGHRGQALLDRRARHERRVHLCDQISVLVYGEVIATGEPEDVRANRAVQEAYLGEEVA